MCHSDVGFGLTQSSGSWGTTQIVFRRTHIAPCYEKHEKQKKSKRVRHDISPVTQNGVNTPATPIERMPRTRNRAWSAERALALLAATGMEMFPRYEEAGANTAIPATYRCYLDKPAPMRE